jgi:hypothetical protein
LESAFELAELGSAKKCGKQNQSNNWQFFSPAVLAFSSSMQSKNSEV